MSRQTVGTQARRGSAAIAVALVAAIFGSYLAILTPATVSIALRVVQVVGEDNKIATLAVVLPVGALAGMLSAPLFGTLSDRTTLRFGKRRTWLTIGPLVGLGGLLLLGSADSVAGLAVGWMLAQLGWQAALIAAQAVLPEHIPEAIRGQVGGMMGVVTAVALVSGTFIVQLVDHNDTLMMALPGLIGVLSVLGLILVLPDHPADRSTLGPFGPREFLSSFYINPKRQPALAWALLSRFLLFSGALITLVYSAYVLTDRVGFGSDAVAIGIFQETVVQYCAALVAAYGFGALSDRIGQRKPFLRLACLLCIAGLLVLCSGTSFGTFLVGVAFIGAGQFGYLGTDLAMAAKLVAPATAARDLGVYNFGLTLPQILIPIYAPLFLAIGDGDNNYPALFGFGALCAVAAMLTLSRVQGPTRTGKI